MANNALLPGLEAHCATNGDRSRRRCHVVPAPWKLSVLTAMSLAVAGCGSADTPPEVTQTITIYATEYAFDAAASFTITAGETVRTVMNNKGTLTHEMQVLDESGRLIDRVGRIEPGASGEVVVSFDEPGIYQLICDIDDHLTRGQRARFRVEEADG